MPSAITTTCCQHGQPPGECETCAAWNSAEHNCERARKAEAEVERRGRIVSVLKRAVAKWRLRDKLPVLLALIESGGVICHHCHDVVTGDDDHWRSCECHPARAEVERLRGSLVAIIDASRGAPCPW